MNGSGGGAATRTTTPASRFIIKLFRRGGVFLPRSQKFVFSTRANLAAPTRNVRAPRVAMATGGEIIPLPLVSISAQIFQ